MEYVVNCSCGRPISVSPAAAGTMVRCACGNEVQVPRLSELRTAAGQRQYESGTVDTIKRLIVEGKLPGARCAISGELTDDVSYFDVECQRVWVSGDSAKAGCIITLLLAVITLPFGWLVYFRRGRRRAAHGDQMHGYELTVRVPLRVCGRFEQRLRDMSQRELHRVLKTAPEYEKLLEQYPCARIYAVKVKAQDEPQSSRKEP